MKTKYAILLSSLFCLTVGFTAGWFGHNHWPHTGIADGHAENAAAQWPESRAKPDQGPSVAPVSSPAIDTPKELTLERLKALSWAKKSGLNINVPVFNFNHDGLDRDFIRIFDLSPGEKTALEAETRKTKQELESMAIQAASVQTSPDGTKITVTVPSLAVQSGPIYDELVHTFADVLGPDRYQALNDISDYAFDLDRGFGVEDARYELAVAPQTAPTDATLYSIKESVSYPSGRMTSSSTLPLNQIPTSFPVLGHCIPPGFGSNHGTH